MLALLAVLFLVVPILELAVIIQVGQAIGVLDTLALLVVISLVGAWLVRREGIGVLRRIQHQVSVGQAPGTELVDGVLILIGGALMLTPGFVTDAAGLSLLLPPVRAALRAVVVRSLRRRVVAHRYDILGERHEGPYA